MVIKNRRRKFSFKEFGYEALDVESMGLEDLLKLIQKEPR